MDPRRLRQLAAVDWDFVMSTETAAAGVHWYPGSFVPDLPGALIEALSGVGDSVIDPYGGVGTTSIAAVARGRSAICCDINPIAVLSSFIGITLIALRFEKPDLYEAVFENLKAIVEASGNMQPSLTLTGRFDTQRIDDQIAVISDRHAEQVYRDIVAGPPMVDALRPWYDQETLSQLLDLMERVSGIKESCYLKLVGFGMISAVARQLSSQTRSWGHIADKVYPDIFQGKNVVKASTGWLRRTYNRLNQIKQLAPLPDRRPFFSPRLVDWSDRSAEVGSDGAHLLVTSPPYAGAIDYALSQRLSLYLLGRDDEAVSLLSNREMGARRKRFARGHIAVWASDISLALDLQLGMLTDGAHAVFVMPHKDSGRDQGEDALRRTMADKGWRLAFERNRSIRQTRARQSWTSIKQETILIFERAAGRA